MSMLKIAVLDMNEGMKNEGMRCIREILERIQSTQYKDLSWQEFEVRKSIQIPSLDFDVYISSGGPGSPLESINSDWENAYFNWLNTVNQWNNNPKNLKKKYSSSTNPQLYIFFIIFLSGGAEGPFYGPKVSILENMGFLLL